VRFAGEERFITDEVSKIELAKDGGVHRVWVGDDEYRAHAIVLAMGAEPKKLGIPGEEELAARGVSYCGTCDAPFYKEKTTIVVGGGDTAMEDAIFLSKFSSKVTVVHRRNDFRASAIMVDRARQIENLEFMTPYEPVGFEGGANGPCARRCCATRRPARKRRCRSTACSSRSGTSRTRTSSPGRSRWTRTATC